MRFLFGILFFVLVQSYAFSHDSKLSIEMFKYNAEKTVVCSNLLDSTESFFSMEDAHQSYLLLASNILLQVVSNLFIKSSEMKKLEKNIIQEINLLQGNKSMLFHPTEVVETLSICLEEGSNTQSADCSNILNSIKEPLDAVQESSQIFKTLIHRFITILPPKIFIKSTKQIKENLHLFDALMKQSQDFLTYTGNDIITKVSMCIL